MPLYTWTLPADGHVLLAKARVPTCLLAEAPALPFTSPGLSDCDILIRQGDVVAIAPPGTIAAEVPMVDCDRGVVLPRLVDLHTHLDKGHIWPRRANPDGTHLGARTNVAADRETNWTADDVRTRMDFALRCAYAHGTAAIRTHIDSLGKQAAISWPVFAEMRDEWKGRIDLQAVALFPTDFAIDQPEAFRGLADLVARHGGVIGGMTFLGVMPDERTRAALHAVMQAAASRGLDLDFHVDESDLPEARTLALLADSIVSTGFKGKVVAGHCCSLALAPEDEIADTVQRVRQSGLAVVSLPMCNMYLMGRNAGRTPRWRGTTIVQELAAAGVPVCTASDNTRDPFYAYGDLDLLEVYRESVRILQLDHGREDWPQLVSATPAAIMGIDAGRIGTGRGADLILTRARTFNELICRPQNDRAVLVRGRPIDTTPPDYRELDVALGVAP